MKFNRKLRSFFNNGSAKNRSRSRKFAFESLEFRRLLAVSSVSGSISTSSNSHADSCSYTGGDYYTNNQGIAQSALIANVGGSRSFNTDSTSNAPSASAIGSAFVQANLFPDGSGILTSSASGTSSASSVANPCLATSYPVAANGYSASSGTVSLALDRPTQVRALFTAQNKQEQQGATSLLVYFDNAFFTSNGEYSGVTQSINVSLGSSAITGARGPNGRYAESDSGVVLWAIGSSELPGQSLGSCIRSIPKKAIPPEEVTGSYLVSPLASDYGLDAPIYVGTSLARDTSELATTPNVRRSIKYVSDGAPIKRIAIPAASPGADSQFRLLFGTQDIPIQAGNEFNFETVQAGGVLEFTLADIDVAPFSDPEMVIGLQYGSGTSVRLDQSVTQSNVAPTGVVLQDAHALIPASQDLTTGFPVADIVPIDDGLGSNLFSLTGADAASFEVVGNQLRLKPGVVLNQTTKSTYNVTVRVDDPTVGTAIDAELNFALTVIAPSHIPTAIQLSGSSVQENAAAGTVIGTLSTTDADVGDTFTYTLDPHIGDLDTPQFSIQGNQLKLDQSPDFETQSSYAVHVRTTDQSGLWFEKVLTVNVVDHLDGSAGDDTFVLDYSGSGVSVSVQGSDGFVIGLGTFPLTTPLLLDGIGGNDSVTINGTTGNDIFQVSGGSVKINRATITLLDTENLKLSGSSGNDTYRINANAPLGSITLDDSSGTDTVDFSSTTASVAINLGLLTSQTVNANLRLSLSSDSSIENLLGGNGNDTLAGNSIANRITGNGGNDTLDGSLGNDVLIGGLGDDTYVFSATDGSEADAITELPNQGSDTVSFVSLTTPISLSLGKTTLQSVHTSRTLKLSSASSIENAVGGSGADTLTGNELANVLTGNAGSDTLNGSTGSDTLIGGQGDDTYLFGSATSGLEADSVTELLNEGTDTISFAAISIPVVLSLGTDTTQNVHTNRTLKLSSLNAFENAVGGLGNDILAGNELPNSLSGNAGNDSLNGASGSDVLIGGPGDDSYVFSPAASGLEADTATELVNQGTDTLDFTALTDAIVLNLGATVVQSIHSNRTLKLNSATTFENVSSGSGDDVIIGNAQTNVISGNGGNDVLVGNAGDDQLFGGNGLDILIGGAGQDTLDGGDDDDLLIAGRTTSDGIPANLKEFSKEWSSTKPYATRIANLQAGVGPANVSLKAKKNVLTDTSADTLRGGLGTDWYFKAADDAISDLFAGEISDLL